MEFEAIKQMYIDEVMQDRDRGASELAMRCLEMTCDIIWKGQTMDVTTMQQEARDFVTKLQTARPSMSPIKNVLQMWLENLQSLPAMTLQEYRLEAMSVADQLTHRFENAVNDAASHMASVVEPGMRIITHSYSSTVLQFLKLCKSKHNQVFISESRPLNEGLKLAEALAKIGMEPTLFTDAQTGIWASKANIAIVGADTILQDGALVNKAGTYLLALAAHAEQCPFYTVYESFKQSADTATSVKLEAMSETEIGYQAPEGVHLENHYFDITPAKYITGWVTETGVKKNICEQTH